MIKKTIKILLLINLALFLVLLILRMFYNISVNNLVELNLAIIALVLIFTLILIYSKKKTLTFLIGVLPFLTIIFGLFIFIVSRSISSGTEIRTENKNYLIRANSLGYSVIEKYAVFEKTIYTKPSSFFFCKFSKMGVCPFQNKVKLTETNDNLKIGITKIYSENSEINSEIIEIQKESFFTFQK